MRALPTFKGYTVDERLREFRKVEYGKHFEFISFSSEKGQKLLSYYRKEQSMMLLTKELLKRFPTSGD